MIETDITRAAERVIAAGEAEFERIRPKLSSEQVEIAQLSLQFTAVMHRYVARRREAGTADMAALITIARSLGGCAASAIGSAVKEGKSRVAIANIFMLEIAKPVSSLLNGESGDGIIKCEETAEVHHA